ncbi:sialidase [Bacillus haikouensis]|uniref:F510_1955 family glycosylhydrolase n=1 Tax=Bacillus haikouensis TaxID=1510468 RepID=UPI001556D307|nr:sialidase [Bacillus haikouensis]NQD64354.1 sialidase [Bacillus haikouensis]
MKFKKTIGILFVTGLFMTGCSSSEEDYKFIAPESENVEHLHGAGYPEHSDAFFIASHNGLFKFEDSKWTEANSNKHDYMGFSSYKDGFYSSGHPENGSDLKNPLGLIKSTDDGKTINKLAFYGKTDFHYLSAGYQSGQLLVFNQESNSQLDTGLYSSSDEGENWEKKKMEGIYPDRIGGLAVHPTNKNVAAISSQDGAFLSEDGGDTFSPINQGKPTTSILLNDKTGIYSSVDGGGINLVKFNLETLEEREYQLPPIKADNPIMFIAYNPNDQSELTFVTYKNDIYRTKDNGNNWTEIMDRGIPQ